MKVPGTILCERIVAGMVKSHAAAAGYSILTPEALASGERNGIDVDALTDREKGISVKVDWTGHIVVAYDANGAFWAAEKLT